MEQIFPTYKGAVGFSAGRFHCLSPVFWLLQQDWFNFSDLLGFGLCVWLSLSCVIADLCPSCILIDGQPDNDTQELTFAFFFSLGFFFFMVEKGIEIKF